MAWNEPGGNNNDLVALVPAVVVREVSTFRVSWARSD